MGKIRFFVYRIQASKYRKVGDFAGWVNGTAEEHSPINYEETTDEWKMDSINVSSD